MELKLKTYEVERMGIETVELKNHCSQNLNFQLLAISKTWYCTIRDTMFSGFSCTFIT